MSNPNPNPEEALRYAMGEDVLPEQRHMARLEEQLRAKAREVQAIKEAPVVARLDEIASILRGIAETVAKTAGAGRETFALAPPPADEQPPAAGADHPIHALLLALTSEGAMTDEAAVGLTRRYYRAIRDEHPAGEGPGAPVDRAAVLLGAADYLDGYIGQQSSSEAPEVEGARLVVRELRRLAGGDQEQGASTAWEAVAHDLENKLKAESERRYNAERDATLADSVVAETKRLMERRTTTLRHRAEQAEAERDQLRVEWDSAQRAYWNAHNRLEAVTRLVAEAQHHREQTDPSEREDCAMCGVNHYDEIAAALDERRALDPAEVAIARVRRRVAEWAVTGEQPNAYITFADAAAVLLEDLDGPKPSALPEAPQSLLVQPCTQHTGAERQLYGCSGPDPAAADA